MMPLRFSFLAIVAASGFTTCTKVVPARPAPSPPAPKQKVEPGNVTAISVSDFFALQQADKVLTLDARPGFYFGLGHIPGAIRSPKQGFAARFVTLEKEIKTALTAGKTIVVYCTDLQCPDARGLAACLAQSGYSSSILTGGWASWKESGLPVE